MIKDAIKKGVPEQPTEEEVNKELQLEFLKRLEDEAVKNRYLAELNYRAARSGAFSVVPDELGLSNEEYFKKSEKVKNTFTLRLQAIREIIKEVKSGDFNV